MDLVTFVGLIGSFASIASYMRENGQPVTVAGLLARLGGGLSTSFVEFGSIGHIRMPGGRTVTEDDALEVAALTVALNDNEPAFLERISARCLLPWRSAIDDHKMDEFDLDMRWREARRCVCDNLSIAVRGQVTLSPPLRELWRQFQCSQA